MGVKLQLLLGLFLFGSVCCSESNGTNFQNASSEKIDSSRNSIEKLPKTDSQINLVNKDTHDDPDSDSFKFSNYSVDNYTIKNETNQEDKDSGRQDKSRSINVNRFASPDYHTNEYLSDNQKFIENSIHKSSTKGYLDFSNFHLTTPKTKDHDSRYEEAKQIIEQEYEENNQENLDEHHLDENLDDDHKDISHDIHIDRLFGNSKHNPNASLDYKERTKILKNNTFDDSSEHNRFSVVKVQKLNFASEYNSTLDEDDTTEVESTPSREKIETTSSRGFLTTRKPITLTKPPTSHNNHLLNNKIESETIKAINSLTTEYPISKILNGENEIIPKEQNVDENKIIAIETTNPETVSTTTTTEKVNTTEQIQKTISNVVTTTNPTTTEQLETTITNDITTDHRTTEIDDNTNETVKESTTAETTETNNEISTTTNNYIDDAITTNKMELTTMKTTTDNKDVETISTTLLRDETTIKTTTDNKDVETISTTLLRDETTIEPSTVTPTKEDATVTTTLSTETTEASTDETTKVTTEEYINVTTEDITTETSGKERVSKAFTFENTTEQVETTTETITSKLFPASETQVEQKTDIYTLIKNGTEMESTTLESKTEVETTTDVFTTSNSLKWETTTNTVKEVPGTNGESTSLSPLKENITTINYVNVRSKNSTLPSTETSTTSSNIIPTFTNVSNSRNSSVTEEVTVITTWSTEETDSSSVPDPGNIGGIEDNKGKIAAIVISTVGALSLILLAGLLYIMRKRQKRFNYKQRCRPVSLDHYSVDNVSGYNSTRRKAERQSKRSYGNPAFDDPVALTHPLNLPALAKFATNAEDVKAEFEEIPQITAKISELPDGCEPKNRYANVIPLPETRVFLQPIDGYPNSDYINANYVTGPKNTKGYYIACQAPMQNTVDDFWRMVWEQQSKVILMITHLFENGVEKCVDYLPPSEVLDCNRLFGDFQVTLRKRDVKEKYIISNLQLKNMVSNSWREVTHFWYLGWPEKGVPSEENSLIAFLIEARSYMKSATLDKNAATNGDVNGPQKNEINPVVVHCSPGTGRTGVVMACDIAIREFEQTRLVDIPKIVYRIRRDRASAVQTKEQYMLIYKVVSLYATKLTGGALESF